MADRLYLSLWFPTFGADEMMARTLSVLRQFPFSATKPGVGYVGVHAISWTEPVISEYSFEQRATPEQAIAFAGEHVHSDNAYEFEVMWDLWTAEVGGGLDPAWRLTPQPVKFLVHGTDFEDGVYQDQGHIQVDFGIDTPFLHEDIDFDHDSEQRVKANVQKLVSFTSVLEKEGGIGGRILWSDSDENLAQKLISRLQRVQ
jgi:hypothetical protein